MEPALDGRNPHPPVALRRRSAVGRGIDLMLIVLASAATLTMMVHVVADAAMRSLLNEPLPSTIEVVAYWYMPFVTLTGFVIATSDSDHIEAGILHEKLPRPVQIETQVLGYLLTAGVAGAFGWFGLQEALHAREIGLTGGVGGLVIWPTLFMVPISCAAVCAILVVHAVRIARERTLPQEWQPSDRIPMV